MALFDPSTVHLKNGASVLLRPARVEEAEATLQAYRQPDGTYTDDISMYLDLTAGS